MKAAVWNGRRDVRIENVADPTIEAPTDAIIRVTSSGLCGSDLHLYEVLTPFMTPGDILGHEPIGTVVAVGSVAGEHVKVGQRVVVPFNIACGSCFMCSAGLQSQCETTQNAEYGTGGSLFGYTRLYGQVPGAQAEYLRVPHAGYGLIPIPEGPPDDRFVYLSDVLPTAWQAVQYAGGAALESLVVLGLGPIGDMCTRVAAHLGIERIIGVELVASRLRRVSDHGVPTVDLASVGEQGVADAVLAETNGRGADAVIDAVGMEAHGSPYAKAAQMMTLMLPRNVSGPMMRRVGVDRLAALHLAIRLVRRGGTLSLSGVYGGMTDPMPLFTLFDKQVTIRMGQANVKRWIDDLMPLVSDDDVLGVDRFASHRLPLDSAPDAYAAYRRKDDGMVKVLFRT